MDQRYLDELYKMLWSKPHPNAHEKNLFKKTQKYIQYIAWIPGIEMIAVCNSVAFYATHKDSDIDLFVITQEKRLWIVRSFMTVIFFILGVWRKGSDIREHFCLSFFITTKALDLKNIAIPDDIYLMGWIHTLKPIINHNHTYERFLEANNDWVKLTGAEKIANMQYIQTHKDVRWWTSIILDILEQYLQYFLFPRTLKRYKQLGKPWWVILSEHMLKFHDQDKRIQIRDTILEKNFDK